MALSNNYLRQHTGHRLWADSILWVRLGALDFAQQGSGVLHLWQPQLFRWLFIYHYSSDVKRLARIQKMVASTRLVLLVCYTDILFVGDKLQKRSHCRRYKLGMGLVAASAFQLASLFYRRQHFSCSVADHLGGVRNLWRRAWYDLSESQPIPE